MRGLKPEVMKVEVAVMKPAVMKVEVAVMKVEVQSERGR